MSFTVTIEGHTSQNPQLTFPYPETVPLNFLDQVNQLCRDNFQVIGGSLHDRQGRVLVFIQSGGDYKFKNSRNICIF